MGVFIHMRSMRVYLSLCLLFCLTLSMPFSSLANTASSSNVERVATSSNALPSQEYMETDDFDTLDIMPMSDGDLPYVSNTVNVSGCYLSVAYYDMSGKLKFTPAKYFNSDHYASIGVPNDCASVSHFVFSVEKSALPSSGVYSLSAHFASNTGVEYKLVRIYSSKNNSNASTQESSLDISFIQSSGDWYCSTVVDVGTVSNIQLWLIPKSTSTINLPYGGFLDINFTKTSASPNYTAAGGAQTTDDIQSNIADNTARQVEQGDTIIELIKNTIQTISSQLTSFWNQLAGEFTNLYNKMNQQHQESINKVDEQIDNDNANTDKVTTAIEAHGNFIIEGLKSLFIPSDEYFKSWFDGMYQFFNDRLGFLMLPVDLLVRMVDIYTSAGSSSAGIPFPEFKWMDGTVIIPAQTVQFDFLNTDWGKGIQDKLYFVGNLIMIGALLSLMHRKFEEVLRN